MLTEADTRTYCDLRFQQELLGKFHRAQRAILFGNLRPREHRRLRQIYWPSQLVQPRHQHVAAVFVSIANLGDTLLRPFQRRDRGYLDRRESSIVEVTLEP